MNVQILYSLFFIVKETPTKRFTNPLTLLKPPQRSWDNFCEGPKNL